MPTHMEGGDWSCDQVAWQSSQWLCRLQPLRFRLSWHLAMWGWGGQSASLPLAREKTHSEAQASRCLASKHSSVASGPSRVRLEGAGKATASIPIPTGRRGARLLPPHQFLPGEEQQLSLWRDTRHGTGEALGRSARTPLEVAVAPRLCWHNAPQLWHVLWGAGV